MTGFSGFVVLIFHSSYSLSKSRKSDGKRGKPNEKKNEKIRRYPKRKNMENNSKSHSKIVKDKEWEKKIKSKPHSLVRINDEEKWKKKNLKKKKKEKKRRMNYADERKWLN